LLIPLALALGAPGALAHERLDFSHAEMHVPWEYLPSGRRYVTSEAVVRGTTDEVWRRLAGVRVRSRLGAWPQGGG
jgi:hypothetical protein